MYPRLLSTPFLTIHAFGVLLAAAFSVAVWRVMSAARREGLDADRVLSLALWCVVGTFVGAKALMVTRSLPEYLSDPSQLLSLSFVGSAGDFYGGFLGALVAAAVYFARHPELPVWPTADLFGPAIALGQAVGRVGCFMAGDDYGRPTGLPWAVTFTDADAARVGGATLGVPLHPVQLYESLVCLALFFVLARLARRKRFDGEVILAYALMYAVARFLLEFFRGDADRGFFFGGLLSTSQFIALIIFAASSALLAWRYAVCRRGSPPYTSEGEARPQVTAG